MATGHCYFSVLTDLGFEDTDSRLPFDVLWMPSYLVELGAATVLLVLRPEWAPKVPDAPPSK